MKIEDAFNEFFSSHKQHSLNPRLSRLDIQTKLGSNVTEDQPGDKVNHEWRFYADGAECAIWDYKGTKWSAYGPWEVFEKLGMF